VTCIILRLRNPTAGPTIWFECTHISRFSVSCVVVVQGGVRYTYRSHAFTCVARKISDIVVPLNKVADTILEVIITY